MALDFSNSSHQYFASSLQGTFPRMPVMTPGQPIATVDQPDPNKTYCLFTINGYKYLIDSNIPAEPAKELLVKAGYTVNIYGSLISGSVLQPFPTTLPKTASHDIFNVSQFFLYAGNVVRVSASLESMLIDGVVEASNMNVTTVTLAPVTEETSKLKIDKDGNYVVTASPKSSMYLSWDGECFKAFVNKINDDDVKVEGNVQEGKFVCKYGSIKMG